MDTICKPNEDSECPRYFLYKKNDRFPWTQSFGAALNTNSAISSGIRMKESSEHLRMLVLNLMHIDTAMAATGTVEEVPRLAGEAACGTPTVCARRWTGQTHTPAPVLIGALRTMSATLMSETGKKKKKKKNILST